MSKNRIIFESENWILIKLIPTNKIILACNGYKPIIVINLSELDNNTFYISINNNRFTTSNKPIVDDKYSFPAKFEIKKRVAKLNLGDKEQILFKKVKNYY